MTPPEILTMPSFKIDSNLILFFKTFDSVTQTVNYGGSLIVGIEDKLSGIVPKINELLSFPPSAEVVNYKIGSIADTGVPLVTILKNGDVLIVERTLELDEASQDHAASIEAVNKEFSVKWKESDLKLSDECSKKRNYVYDE